MIRTRGMLAMNWRCQTHDARMQYNTRTCSQASIQPTSLPTRTKHNIAKCAFSNDDRITANWLGPFMRYSGYLRRMFVSAQTITKMHPTSGNKATLWPPSHPSTAHNHTHPNWFSHHSEHCRTSLPPTNLGMLHLAFLSSIDLLVSHAAKS